MQSLIRWHWFPAMGIAAGIALVVVSALWRSHELGWWQLPIYLGCLLAAAAILAFRREVSQAEQAVEQFRRELAARESELARRQEEFAEIRKSIEKELFQEAARLDRREQTLLSRLTTYHEWMEFPRPVEIAVAPAAAPEELAAKDRELHELLRQQTAQLYENILQNKYAAGGKVLLAPIRDDLVALVTRVARIYQPQVEQPLLEASLEDIFRGVSRASLQLLAALDELPVDVQRASLSTLYSYVQGAVKTWRMYKSAEPYWPYVNTAYYLSRLAMGANPVTMGTWWFLSHLGRRGAQALAQHLINRQALALLSNLVRIVGYEAASVFGGDFRHRDPNWIYATELTELVRSFPLSRESLSHALREIGTLHLRSEYDRTFLYRCLAERQTAHPERYPACELLSVEERRAIADRLERFLEHFIHGRTTDRLRHWRQGVEQRLGVKLSGSVPATAAPRQQQAEALRSLASFLVAVKQLEPPEALPHLLCSGLAAEWPAEEAGPFLEELAQNASYFFEYPDLDPASELTDHYLRELARLQAMLPPRGAAIETTVFEAGAYLRRDRRTVQSFLDEAYAAELARRVAPGGCPRSLPSEAARAVLDLTSAQEPPLPFVYPAQLEKASGPSEAAGGGLWLVGRTDRLLLLQTGDPPQVLWQARASEVRLEPQWSLWGASCRLAGGHWEGDGPPPEALRITAGLLATASAFQPLLDFLQRSDASSEPAPPRSGPEASRPAP